VKRRAKEKRPQHGAVEIQITSMLDMFTILISYLLVSVSASPMSIHTVTNQNLPYTSSQKPMAELLSVIVDKSVISVEGKGVASHKNGVIDPVLLDQNGFMIKPAFDEFLKHAEKLKYISSINKKVDAEGRVLLEMDKDLPFTLLRQIMYTAGQAGYNEFKFIALKKE
jgi:biopolymer transport protein ExbD